MVGALASVALASAACDLVLSDSFTFVERAGPDGGSGAGGAGNMAGAAGAGGSGCALGGQAWLRLANVLDEPRSAHVCIRYAGEQTHYVAQSAAHGFVGGVPPATVTRYRPISSGLVSIGLASSSATDPCAEPLSVRDLCLPAGTHGTLVMAGDRGASPPTAALEFVEDLAPEKVENTRTYSRVIHAIPTPPPQRPWLDVIVWSTVSKVWILPFRNLQFGTRPVTQPKLDAFNPINSLGYTAGYFGIDTVRTMEVLLPLALDLGGFFQFSPEQLEAYHQRPPSTPVTTLIWGNLRPEEGLDAPSYPGLRLLSCLDDHTPGPGAIDCFEVPRVVDPGLDPLPRFRAGNPSSTPVRFCMLPFSASNSYALRKNMPGWGEMSPQGIVVEPFQMLRDRVLPHNDYVIASMPLEKTCDQVEPQLAQAGYDQESCTTSGLVCDDLVASAMKPEHSTATVVFDGLARRPIFFTVRPTPGKVTARLSNIMRGDTPLDASLDGSPLWPAVAPNLTYFHAGVYYPPEGPPEPMKTAPAEVEAVFAPASGARFRWVRGGQKAVSATPVDFAGQAGRAFVLWAGGDAAKLGTDDPEAPFLWVCDNEATEAPTLDCTRIPMVPDE